MLRNTLYIKFLFFNKRNIHIGGKAFEVEEGQITKENYYKNLIYRIAYSGKVCLGESLANHP